MDDLRQATISLLDPDLPWFTNMANLSSLLFDSMTSSNIPVNWVGFYLKQKDHLVLGPFQGRVACTRIAMGKGVCGTAALQKTIQVVPDVHAFPGHIACDSRSESEVVIPLIKDGVLYGVLDIDALHKNAFSSECVSVLVDLVAHLNNVIQIQSIPM
jgi:L-methionine (R)-S-oxide reductase